MLKNGEFDVPAGKLATVVTHLEMRAPASLRPVDVPDGIAFRAVEADVTWYRDVFGRVGLYDWLWYGRLVLEESALAAILQDPDVHLFTLCKEGQDEALLELDFRTPGACELAYFGLTSTLIGTGAGRYLMNEAIKRAWSRPIERFHVHTCTFDSPQALPFYQRSGFAQVRQEIYIDDDPRLTGEVPRDAGPNVPIFDGSL
ncbi:MAG: GNAT family N-acetyltransferase [Roseobacter sp.]